MYLVRNVFDMEDVKSKIACEILQWYCMRIVVTFSLAYSGFLLKVDLKMPHLIYKALDGLTLTNIYIRYLPVPYWPARPLQSQIAGQRRPMPGPTIPPRGPATIPFSQWTHPMVPP